MDFKAADELIKKLMTVEEAKQTLQSHGVIYEEYRKEKNKYDHYVINLNEYRSAIKFIENKEYYIEKINKILPIYIKENKKRNTKNNRRKAMNGVNPFNRFWKYKLEPKHYYANYNNQKQEDIDSITVDELNTYNADDEKAKLTNPAPNHDNSILNDGKKNISLGYINYLKIYTIVVLRN